MLRDDLVALCDILGVAVPVIYRDTYNQVHSIRIMGTVVQVCDQHQRWLCLGITPEFQQKLTDTGLVLITRGDDYGWFKL
jgi:hypothetical protein